MNRAALRWFGIGLVICALASLAVSLWLGFRTLNMKPFDGTYTGIGLSLTLWGMAAGQLGLLVWKRAQPPSDSTERRFRIQPSMITSLPLGVQLTFALVQTLFLISVATLTLAHSTSGVVLAHQQSVAADLLVAQAVINVLMLILGGVWLNFQCSESPTV